MTFFHNLMWAAAALFLFLALVSLDVEAAVTVEGVALRRGSAVGDAADAFTSAARAFRRATDPLRRERRTSVLDIPSAGTHEPVGRGPTCRGAPTIPSGIVTKLKVATPADGVREVAVYVPKSYEAFHRQSSSTEDGAVHDNYSSVSVQMLFHGLNDECQHFLGAVGLMEYAERDGYVIASACGSMGWLGTAWNAGTCCGFFTENKPDELAFSLAILETLRAHNICVDDERVMAVGFSNGAMLSEVLACEKPQVFRAVVSIGGVVEMRPGGEEGLTKCDETVAYSGALNRANVLMVHGDADQQVPWTGSSLLGFPDIPKNVAGWVHRHGCGANPTTTLNTSKYVNFVYDNCTAWYNDESLPVASAATPIVELVQVRGGQHRWPEDDEFSTTDYIYQFGRRAFGSY